MEINIYRKDLDFYYKRSQVLWRDHNKSSKIAIYIFSIFGVLLFILALLEDKKLSWDFNTSLGLALILVSLINSYHLIKAKKKFFNEVQGYIKHWKKNNSEAHIKLNDEKIYYKDSQTIIEQKWSIFSSANIENGLIIFKQTNQSSEGFAIGTTEITEAELKELTNIVRNKIKRGA